MPFMDVDTFGSLTELQANHPEQYFHYFVAMNIVLQDRRFFTERRNKTIVLSMSLDDSSSLTGFNSLCVNVSEKALIRSLLALVQHAHGHGQNLPPIAKTMKRKILTDRETEVMALIVQGNINKEIADKLHISMPTVATHRKNIMEKLGIRSVSALTIYAVTHGYVDINKI